jgi:excisionase family DNA binding protein
MVNKEHNEFPQFIRRVMPSVKEAELREATLNPLLNRGKSRKVETDPVPFLDNTSADSEPTIELLTVAEVAQVLKISISGVRRLQERRLIPFFKIGGGIRFATSDILSYLQKQRVEAIDQI